MTLAIGVLCQEGAVVVSDSMCWRLGPDGRYTGSTDVKFYGLPGFAGIYIPWWADTPIELNGGDMSLAEVGADAHMWTRVCNDLGTPDGWPNHQPQTLVAGTEGGQVRLGLYVGQEPPRWASNADSVLHLGIASQVLPRPSRAIVATLDEATDIAVDDAVSAIRLWYAQTGHKTLADFVADGVLPPVAEPLLVVTLRPNLITHFVKEIPELAFLP